MTEKSLNSVFFGKLPSDQARATIKKRKRSLWSVEYVTMYSGPLLTIIFGQNSKNHIWS